MEIDEAEARIIKIAAEVLANLKNIQSEEDSKIQIVNRILTESLGWLHADVRAENHHENGYSDYILCITETPSLLVEAKRLGLIDIATAEKNKVRYLKISGSGMKSALKGVEQAVGYAAPNGMPIAVLTDGMTWVVFRTFTPGVNYKSREAIVFPSLEAVIADFSLFYDLLSKQQFSKRLYNSIFDDIHNKRLLLTQKLVSPIDENHIFLSQKSAIAFDLENVFSAFFSRLSGDNDEDLLLECFVESRESRIADFSLEKITTAVLGNIVPSERRVDSELAKLIATNVDTEYSQSESGQTIFIVGPTGAGKSTFLDRFFRKTLPGVIRKRCVLLSLNFLDATGRDDIALAWLTEQLIVKIEQEIYDEGTPSWDELVGLYNSEYLRRCKGVDSQIYKEDKDKFKKKFGEYLENKVETDREGYLNRILQDAVRNRKHLPIIVIDNTDEFTIAYKQKVFQFVQSLQRNIKHCLVIFPVTDKSAWSFSKTDIFSIYQSRSFFLPTPSPREVFRKRIEFLNKRIHDEKAGKSIKANYFSNKGAGISIKDLEGFAKVLETVFVDHDYTSKTIGELTNYNIRRSLVLSQRVITSSVIKIEDLIKAYVSGTMVTANFNLFVEALMKGNYEVYKRGDNPEIYPIFQVDPEVKQSPLLKMRILALLSAVRGAGRSVEERHIGAQSIIEYFDAIGCAEIAVEKALISLLEAGLIEPFDVSDLVISSEQKLAISYRGMAHLRLALHNSIFFFQMALVTAIANEERALQIGAIYKFKASIKERAEKIRTAFLDYLIEEDQKFLICDSKHEKYECQRKLINDLEAISKTTRSHDEELVAVMGEDYKQGIIRSEVYAVIDFFDKDKGFGFAEVEGTSDGVYVNKSKLKEHGIDSLKDGDRVLCDLARGPKGLYIEKIHLLDTDEKIEVTRCQVVKIIPDRGYGFVRLEDGRRDAFFHISVFDKEKRDSIRVGDWLKAEICADRGGRGFQIRAALEILDSED